MKNIERFELNNSRDQEDILREIGRKYSTRMEPLCREKYRYYDTFDWSLLNNGLSVNRVANHYSMQSLTENSVVSTATWNGREQPKFWWDFREQTFRNELKTVIDVRALIPFATIARTVQTVRVLNRDEKTVLRIHFEEMRPVNTRAKTSRIRTVSLEPLRGYEKYHKEISRSLRGMGKSCHSLELFQTVLKSAGATPCDYSSKLNIRLKPDMSARQATVIILQRLLQVMGQNESGIKADTDTEFLHDFRVAVRRTRSALSQIKGVFHKSSVDRFKRDFAYVGKLTNRLRDLDVHLFKRDEYKEALPDRLRPGLDPFFQSLLRERTREHRRIVRALDSKRYGKIMEDWEAFLSVSPSKIDVAAKNANKRISSLAGKVILQQYKQVVDLGTRISQSTPDADLHVLRIMCKKLRYLLEFFESLFPQKEVTLLIKQLKRLQENLGDFNDLDVQQQELQEFMKGITGHLKTGVQTAAAIGGLVANISQRQEQVRMLFSEKFDEFNWPENARLYRQLFGRSSR